MKKDLEGADYGGRLWPEAKSSPPNAPSNGIAHRSPSWKLKAGIAGALVLIVGISAVSRGLLASQRGSGPADSIASGPSQVGSTSGVEDPLPQGSESVSHVDVYVALISDIYERHWRRVYVSKKLCNQFPTGHGKCEGKLSQQELNGIKRALPDIELSFRDPPRRIFNDYTNYGRYAALTLGPITDLGSSVQVEAGYYCIYLCGHGTTYVLQERDGQWEVTGQVGQSWVS
jgi:hypothetical protein